MSDIENLLEQSEEDENVLRKMTFKKINSSRKKENIPVSNFNTLEKIPEQFKKLLELEEEMLSRTHITNKMYLYIIKNDLYDKDTCEITPTKEMIKIFKMDKKATISFHDLPSWIKQYY
jgi:hypothetical protein